MFRPPLRLSQSVRLTMFSCLLVGALLNSSNAVSSTITPPGTRERAPAVTSSATMTRHWSTTGTSFVTAYSGQKWDISFGQHCVYSPSVGGGDLWMERGLELPDHAHITRLELVAVDTDTSFNSALWLETRTMNGGVAGSSIVQSSGSAGNGVFSVDVDINVDNFNYMYALAWTNNGVTGSGIALCGVVVTYDVTFANAMLPLIQRSQ